MRGAFYTLGLGSHQSTSVLGQHTFLSTDYSPIQVIWRLIPRSGFSIQSAHFRRSPPTAARLWYNSNRYVHIDPNPSVRSILPSPNIGRNGVLGSEIVFWSCTAEIGTDPGASIGGEPLHTQTKTNRHHTKSKINPSLHSNQVDTDPVLKPI